MGELESPEGDGQSRQAAENPAQRLRSLDMEGSFMLVPCSKGAFISAL